MRISIVSLLFMALVGHVSCQTSSTDTNAPDNSPTCTAGYFLCGSTCCNDRLGRCATNVVEVPKTTTYVTTTTIVTTTTLLATKIRFVGFVTRI